MSNISLLRSSRSEVFCKKIFLKNLQISQENICTRVPFFIKLQAWPATLLKKDLWHRCFSVKFAKFLRTSFFMEHLRWLHLSIQKEFDNFKIMICYSLREMCPNTEFFSGAYFPLFGLNTEVYAVWLFYAVIDWVDAQYTWNIKLTFILCKNLICV